MMRLFVVINLNSFIKDREISNKKQGKLHKKLARQFEIRDKHTGKHLESQRKTKDKTNSQVMEKQRGHNQFSPNYEELVNININS